MATTAAVSAGRIGGVAVALGIGAAVATGLAASAWASPEDQGDTPARVERSVAARPASSAAQSGTVRAAAATRAAAGPLRRSPSAAAPADVVASTPPRASAAVAPTRRARVLAPAVDPTPIAVPDAPTPAPPVGSPPVAARSAGLLSWLCPDPRGRLITIYKGTHFAIPNNFGFFVQKVTGSGTFTPNSAYDLKDVDQYDWNKFTGIAFTPLEPDRNSVMVGWRYNLQTQMFEVAPFYNVDKKRILPNEDPNSPNNEVVSIAPDQPFTFTVDYNGVTVSNGTKTVYKPFPPGLTANVWTAARVSGWFGGNEVAPRTVSYFIKFA